jgi:ABC-type multidrug transport system fused ATPase/permease subunit
VSFAYDGREVLHDVSFTVRPGEVVAIVGPSGAGKTTLVSLIPRFYEPTAGRVLIDGVDVTSVRLAELRRQVAVVLQDAVIMSGTVGENVLYGRLDASFGDLQQAAHDAHAAEFIAELPDGYATLLGPGGVTLSGGQRQRISMARAFLKNAPILVLDEPTAALDAISTRVVTGVMARLRHGRTTFVIAHNLSTVRDADRILVMERGRIVASGHHAELLATSPLYAELARQMYDPGPGGQ